MSGQDNLAATLYVVATPIGNLGDMTLRAIETLKTVDMIYAEDTRHSKPLLQHFNIQNQLYPLHEHNEAQQVDHIIEQLQQGKKIALISDAGTPLISDPGMPLVQKAKQNNIRVEPIPGACAAIAALSVSGLASDKFLFAGFIPAKHQARLQFLQNYLHQDAVTIFYESPHRIIDCLSDMMAVYGKERLLVYARELTKQFETVKLAALSDIYEFVIADDNQQKGEIVLILDKAAPQNTDDKEALRILKILSNEMSVSQACKLAAKLTNMKKNQLYQLALAHNL